MFQKIEHHLQDISNQMTTLVTTNVAKHLAPFVALASSSSVHVTQPHTNNPAILSQAPNWTPLPCNSSLYSTRQQSPVDNEPSTPVTNIPASSDATPSIDGRSSEPRRLDSESSSDASLSTSRQDDGLSASTVEVKTTQFKYAKELLTLPELTPIYVKSRNRRNFAALLVQKLFDVPTRMKSNVAGRGKEKLDPEIMKYVKAKTFEYYECHPSEVKEEWAKCVVSIDEKSRALKKLKSNKPEKENLTDR